MIPCAGCGALFTPLRSNHRYCSPRESKLAWSRANREQKAAYYRANRDRALAREAARYAANPQRMKNYQAEYRAANPDKVKTRKDAWKATRSEHVKAVARRYYEEHPDRWRDARAARLGAPTCEHPACLTLGAAALAWQTNEHRCYLCGAPLAGRANGHLDHVVPISRGGAHCAENLRPSCPICNLRKGGRLLEELDWVLA